MNEQQATGPQDGAIACQDSLREKERADWKRRQAIQPSAGTWLAPTLPERINRLNPSERHQLSSIIQSLKLRKIVRRVLVEAFWERETNELTRLTQSRSSDSGSMRRLRAAVRAQESMKSYESALTSFEPVYTHSSYGDGNDPPAVTRALERSLIIQR